METVLEHAESRFVVDKRARASVLPPTETCTLIEAAARCGVSQGVMRDILEQRGLIDRPKERGRPFRIPEAEIRIVQGALHNSMDARGAADLLGTTTRVVRDLTALGLLQPYVSGGRRTKHAHVYLQADVQSLHYRLAAGLSIRLRTEEDEITLTAAAYAYTVPLAVLCREALEGRLSLWGQMATGSELQGLIVRREEVLMLRRRLRSFPKETCATAIIC